MYGDVITVGSVPTPADAAITEQEGWSAIGLAAFAAFALWVESGSYQGLVVPLALIVILAAANQETE